MANQEPKSHGSGSGTIGCYVVEARSTYSNPQTISGMMLDTRWRVVRFPNSPIGVKVDILHREAQLHGLFNYEAAMALAHWFMSEPDEHGIAGLCIETRIVKVDYSYQYSTKEVGVGPAMSSIESLRGMKFEPRLESGG